MIKLNKSGTLICTEGIRCVRRVVEREVGRVSVRPSTRIDYKDNSYIELDYGWDGHYYAISNTSLDADYAQIEGELLGVD